MLSTAGEQHTQAVKSLRKAEDLDWDNPTNETARKVRFWTGQVDEFAVMNPDTIIPLF
jgi:hypothetical protein